MPPGRCSCSRGRRASALPGPRAPHQTSPESSWFGERWPPDQAAVGPLQSSLRPSARGPEGVTTAPAGPASTEG
eukprot:15437188-Alexandrium_andersonii.AAC.1